MTELLDAEATEGSASESSILSVSFEERGSVCLVTLRGQLTRTSVAALDAQVDQIGCAGCKRLILDVTELIGLDDVGSRVLAGLNVYVRALGAQLTITGATRAVAETLARSPSALRETPNAAVPDVAVNEGCLEAPLNDSVFRAGTHAGSDYFDRMVLGVVSEANRYRGPPSGPTGANRPSS